MAIAKWGLKFPVFWGAGANQPTTPTPPPAPPPPSPPPAPPPVVPSVPVPSIGKWFSLLTSSQNTWSTWSGGTTQAPVLTLGTPYTFGAREQQPTVGTYGATDPQGFTLTYTIVGGADAGKFNINTSTGALTFKVAPVFASPGSAAGTNLYTIVVQAASTAGLSSSGTVYVQVQQLVAGGTYQVRATVHPSAVGATNVNAIVWDTSGGLVGNKLFELTGLSFLSQVNGSNQAVILVPVPNGVTVTNGQSVKIYLNNTNFYTPIFTTTVEQI